MEIWAEDQLETDGQRLVRPGASPPVVGGFSYLSLSGGPPDLLANMLLGYGLYQAALLLRLLPWIRKQAFSSSYWAFSFGVAALPTLAMRMVERGATGPIEWLALVLFIGANAVIGLLIAKTLALLGTGRLVNSTGTISMWICRSPRRSPP